MMVCDTMRRSFDERYQRAVDLITEFHRQVTAAGSTFVLMVIPDEYQIDPELRAATLEYLEHTPDRYDWEKPQRFLSEWCAERGIHCLDLLPAFRAFDGEGPLYRLRNTHWSEVGNQLAARELARFLHGLGVAPRG